MFCRLLCGILLFSFFSVKSQTVQKQIDKAVFFYENFHKKKADSILKSIKNSPKTIQQKIMYCFLNDNIHRKFSSNQLLKKLSDKQIQKLPSLHKSILLGTSSLNYANNWNAPKMYSSVQKAMKYAQPINKINSIYELLPYSAFCLAQFANEKYGDATQTVHKIYPVISSNNYDCSKTKGTIYNIMGLATIEFGQKELSIKLQEANLKCLQNTSEIKPDLLYSTYNNLGQTNIVYGDYQKAMEYQLKAKEIGDKYYKSQYSYEWFWHMGWLNYNLGNYDLFEHYTQKAYNIIVKELGKNHIDYILINRVFVEGYLKFGDYTNARKKLLLIQNTLKNDFTAQDETNIFLEIQLGRVDVLEKKYKSAVQHLKKAYHFLKNKDFYYQTKIEVSFYLALTYSRLKNNKKANELLIKCFEYLNKTNSWSTNNWKVKAQLLYLRINKDKTTQQDYEKLINQSSMYLFNQKLMLAVYKEYSYFLLSKNKLTQANKMAEKGLRLLNDSNAVFGNIYHPVSQEAKEMIEVAQSVYLKSYLNHPNYDNLNTLFKSTEYKKANTLQNVFYQKKLKSMAYIPDTIFRKEQFLKNRISILKNEIQSAEREGEDTKLLLKKLTEINYKYTNFIAKHKKKYPKYFGIMFPQISNISEVQKHLGKQQCVLSFNCIEKEYYAICINKANAQLFQLPKKEYSATITKLNLAAKENNIDVYKKVAYELYTCIFKPIESVLRPNIIYIPTKDLAYLNLETIITKPSGKQFDELEYLLKQYNFSINYSVNLMMQNVDSKMKNTFKMLAFAPIFDGQMKSEYLQSVKQKKIDSQYIYLLKQPFSKKMLENIPKRYRLKKYIGTLAKEETFKQYNKNYDILHLSTHTLLNPVEPMNSKIYFAKTNSSKKEDGDLHLHEIYGMTLNNDLTVLSTCDAAKSNFANTGNELISLTHSFAYAGSKNLIYTLWSIDEKQSQIILSDFYDKLKTHSSFSKKIRDAKLAYLKKVTPQLASPYYWGGIVIQSGFELTKDDSTHWFFWILGGLILFFGGFFIGRKKYI